MWPNDFEYFSNKDNSRPKTKRNNGELRSFIDLNLDYGPMYFIRCHNKENSLPEQETKVWRCAFEPDPNNPSETTHIVATCGGEAVCLIDCDSGVVTNRYIRRGEEFMALAWITVETEPGNRYNILAAGGTSSEIRLHYKDSDMGYCDMKGHTTEISSLVFNPHLPHILFSGDIKAFIFIWDISPQVGHHNKLMRFQLLMRLKCPRADLNPVTNLIYLDHYHYLIAIGDDAFFAWKIQEFRHEKREREPDMELKIAEPHKLDVKSSAISYDGLALLGKTGIVFKVLNNPNLLVFDFGTTLERRKGLQKIVPIEICVSLEWCKTNACLINISTRSNLGAVLCGDDNGNISIYDLYPYIEDNPEKIKKAPMVPRFKLLEWPECSNDKNLIDSKYRVINTVEMSSDGHFIVGVTDNNLVCVWKLVPNNNN